MSTRGKILTYALVGQGLGGNRDPIAALAPFLAPIAQDLDGQNFDGALFRAEMNDRYGISLSRDVTELFVQRLVGLAYLSQSSNGFTWKKKEDASSDTGTGADKITTTLELAKSFYLSRADLVAEKFDEDQFLGALLTVLLNKHQPLNAAVSALDGTLASDVEKAKTVHAKTAHEYYASEFIVWTNANRKDVFGWLAELSATALVAEALIQVRTPDLNRQTRTDLTVYLDTPVLMEALGCSGLAAREDAASLIKMLKSLRISVCVLSYSIVEIQRNLKAVLRNAPSQRVGPTAKALLFRETTESHLTSLLENPEYFIREAGFQIVDPRKTLHLIDAAVFSDDDAKNFYAQIFSLHDRDEPRQHDVACISWVIRRRKHDTSPDILTSKHILLTRNVLLAKTAAKIARERAEYGPRDWGPAVSVRDMAGVMWLVVGQSERTEISKRQLILNCDRAKAAAPQIISGMLETLRTVDRKNADLLWVAVQKPAYLSLALDATAQSTRTSTTDVAELALSKIRDDLVADERAKAATKLARERERADAEASLAKAVVESLEEQKQGLENRTEFLLSQFREISNMEWTAARVRAATFSRALLLALEALLFTAAVMGAVAGTDVIKIGAVPKAIFGSACAGIVLYLSRSWVKERIRRIVQDWCYRRYRSHIMRVAGPIADEVLIQKSLLEGLGDGHE